MHSRLRRAPAFWFAAALAAPAIAQNGALELVSRLPDEAVAVVWCESAERAVAAIGATAGPLPEGLPPEVSGYVGAGLIALRATLRGSIGDTAGLLAGGGIAIGMLPAEPRANLFVAARPNDRDAALRWCQRFPERLHAALDGDVLLASDSAAGLQRLQRGERGGRWSEFDFGDAPATAVLRGAVDLARLRERAGSRRWPGAARFLLLPIADAIGSASWLRFHVDAARTLAIEVHADSTVLRSPHAPLLAHPGERVIVPLAANGLALVSLDRSLHALFTDLSRHLEPAEVVAAQGFLSIADALDGPRSSFVDDLLGGLDEPFVLHVTPASAAVDDAGSPLQLPEFAFVAGLRDPATADVLSRLTQVFVTIANAERAQRGQGLFRLRRVADDHGTGFVAEPPPWNGPGLPPLDRQLSPTVRCGHGVVVLASTEAAARGILERTPSMTVVRGDVLELRGPAIAAALSANRTPLELARMLDEGEDDVAARRVLDIVIAVARAIDRLVVTTDVDAASTRLRIEMERRR